MRIGVKFATLIITTTILSTSVLFWLAYSISSNQYILGIDRQLKTAAIALPELLEVDYIEESLSAESVDQSLYDAKQEILNHVADQSRLEYIYIFKLEGDKVIQIISSASKEDREKDELPEFREVYPDPPAELLSSFKDGKTRFVDYTDAYGSVRSIFVPHKVADGTTYIAGVDVSLSEINAGLQTLILSSLIASVIVAVLMGTAGIVISKHITQPLEVLSTEVSDWAERDFEQNEEIQTHLTQLSSNQDETGNLAKGVLEVQDRLQTYLKELVETTSAKQKIEQELEIAKKIQEGLLPKETPDLAHFEITGWSQAAEKTGGDYFDWMELSDGKLLFTLGDVTGHGVGPSLLAAAARAYTRASVKPGEPLEDMLAHLNYLLHLDLQGERFVTLVACVLDPESREVKLVSAGHGPNLIYSHSKDEVDACMETHGLPLGIIDETEYDKPLDIQMEPGDALVLVSDGFFEWSNEEGENFGTDRLSTSIQESCRDKPGEIIESLKADLSNFHGGTAQLDDTTILVLRCTS